MLWVPVSAADAFDLFERPVNPSAKALLMAADGVASEHIAVAVGVSPATVRAWRSRLAEEDLAKLEQVGKGVGQSRRSRGRRWSRSGTTRCMPSRKAKRIGAHGRWPPRRVSRSTVQPIWHARRLKHRVDTFTLSTDPAFEDESPTWSGCI
jgi:Winged helix-turn helix